MPKFSLFLLLPKFVCLDRSFVTNDLDCLEVKGVSRGTVAWRRGDAQARHPLALKGLEVLLLLDREGFP